MTEAPHPAPAEEQRFRQPWLWVLILASTVPLCGALALGTVSQLVTGEPWGSKPMSDGAAILVCLATLSLSAAVITLFWKASLRVEVRLDGVLVSFWPFVRAPLHYTWDQIQAVEPVAYEAIGTYGGWGVRRARGTTVYNVSGDRGVLLSLASGAKVLLGSQRAEELAALIAARRADVAATR